RFSRDWSSDVCSSDLTRLRTGWKRWARRKAAGAVPARRRRAAVWSKIRAVWSRELLDTVRDQRTVYMMILLPIVIMPVIMMVGRSEERRVGEEGTRRG